MRIKKRPRGRFFIRIIKQVDILYNKNGVRQKGISSLLIRGINKSDSDATVLFKAAFEFLDKILNLI